MAGHRLPAIRHGEQRWQNGWSLPELVRDYQLLRTVTFEYLDEALGRPLLTREVLALNLAFDEAISASVGMYVAGREDAVRHAERTRVEGERQAEERLRQQAEALKCPTGAVPPFGRNKGKRGSICGMAALGPHLGSGKRRRISRERRW